MKLKDRRIIVFGYRGDLLDSSLSTWLDHFRWIAAVVVVWSHLRTLLFPDAGTVELNKFQKIFYFFTLFADEAVVVFFVLSGLLVGGIILRDVRSGRFDFGQYLINRSSRLYVALVPAIVLAVAMQHLYGTVDCRHGPDSWQRIAGNLFYLQNFNVRPLCNDHPLWSLSSEAYYYLLAPPLLIGLVQRSPVALAIAALGLAPALIWLRFDYLTAALGLILWLLGLAVWMVRVRIPWWAAAMPFVAVLLLGRGHVFAHRFEEELLLGPAFILMLCSDIGNVPAIAAQWARRLSAFSYSLYLTHMPLAQAAGHYFGHRGLSPGKWSSYAIYAALLALMVAVGWLFGHLFERRTAELRRAIARGVAAFSAFRPRQVTGE